MKSTIQIITTNVSLQSRPSFLMTFEQNRYLFNVPEGFQRFCFSHGVKLQRISSIFLSKLQPGELAGLPGILFTLADKSKNSKTVLVGALGLSRYLASLHSVIKRPEFTVSLLEIASDSIVYDDGTLVVSSTMLFPSQLPSSEKRKVAWPDAPQKKKLIAEMFAQDGTSRLAPDDEELESKVSMSAICYLCQGPSQPGKFDSQKAQSLGVPKGLERGKLVKGESIVLADGRTIHPQDCVGPERKGPKVLLLDLPSPLFLNSLLDNSWLKKMCAGSDAPYVVVHQLGPGVLEHKDYISWSISNCSKLQNIVISNGLHTKEAVHPKSTAFLGRLSSLDEIIFPKLPTKPPSCPFPSEFQSRPLNFRIAKQKMEFQLQPTPKWIVSTEELETIDVNGSLEDLDPILNQLATLPKLEEYQEEFVIPLGTGSAIPARFRNVSANWINNASGSLLLDVGEGTLGQLDRRFGTELSLHLKKLKFIFISHMHGDHMLGCATLIQEWRKSRSHDQKLHILCPGTLPVWLRVMDSMYESDNDDLVFHYCEHSLEREKNVDYLEGLYRDLELEFCQTVKVQHCHLSFALVLKFKSGFQISYSGDCRPSESFALAGQGSDLLIHEATLDDSKRAEAIAKKHCTFRESIDVAQRFYDSSYILECRPKMFY
jgi:ribonuclease Z